MSYFKSLWQTVKSKVKAVFGNCFRLVCFVVFIAFCLFVAFMPVIFSMSLWWLILFVPLGVIITLFGFLVMPYVLVAGRWH